MRNKWNYLISKLIKFRGLLSIGFADTVGTGITAIFWFYIATVIDPAQYGEIFYFLGIVGIVSSISLFGTQNTITVYVSKNVKIQSTFYFISLVVGFVSSLALIIIFYRIDVSLVLLGYVINTLSIGDLLGRKLYADYSKYVLAQKILTLFLGVGFYYAIGVDGILYALALSYVAYIIRIYKGFRNSKLDFSLLKPRLGFIINNYMMILANVSKNQIDKLIIAPLAGFAFLGNYSLALQVISVLMILPSIVFKYVLTEDARGVQNKKLKKILVLTSIFIAICGFVLLPPLIPLLFPKYMGTIEAIQIMSFSIIPTTISLLFTSKFLALEKSKFILIGKLISLISIITGILLLTPMLGIIGLALSFLLSTVTESIFYSCLSHTVRLEMN